MEEYTYQADKFVFHVRKDLLYSHEKSELKWKVITCALGSPTSRSEEAAI